MTSSSMVSFCGLITCNDCVSNIWVNSHRFKKVILLLPILWQGGFGLKSYDHIQVRYLESALIEYRSCNWKETNSGRQDWPPTWLFVNRGSHFLTLMLEFLPKRGRDDQQIWASSAYILVWADRWKVQFSAILNDNWINFKIESVCQHYELLNVTFWFMLISLVLDLLAKFCQISEKNLNFWHSY